MHRHRPAATVRKFPVAGGLLVLETSSGRLFAYNDSAREVWDLMETGHSDHALAALLGSRYGLPSDVAHADVGAILRDWRSHGIVVAEGKRDVPNVPAPTGAATDWTRAPEPRWAMTLDCSIRKKTFSFAIEPPEIVLFFRMLFEPLAISAARTGIRFEIREIGGEVALVVNGRERMRSRDHGLVIGAVHQAILEQLHPGIDWLAMAHGGAVARNGAGLAISAASGRGKTTLIAYLAAHGYSYLADDVIALSAPDGRIVPWPLPMSVKAGSWDLLSKHCGDLSRFPTYRTGRGELRLVAAPESAWETEPVSLRCLLFPHYIAHAAPQLTRLTSFDAITRLLRDKIWLGYPMTEQRVRVFLDWIEEQPAYELIHGDVVAAARCIEDIL
jgi:hypothetical protein